MSDPTTEYIIGDLGQRLQKAIAQRNVLYATCQRIVDIIDAVENRCLAADGPVTPTSQEITDDELLAIYKAAKEALA